jgi:hypothetical protein
MPSNEDSYTEKEILYFLERLKITMPKSTYDLSSLDEIIVNLGRDPSISPRIRDVILRCDMHFSLSNYVYPNKPIPIFNKLVNAGIFKPFVYATIVRNNKTRDTNVFESFDTVVQLYKQELGL